MSPDAQWFAIIVAAGLTQTLVLHLVKTGHRVLRYHGPESWWRVFGVFFLEWY